MPLVHPLLAIIWPFIKMIYFSLCQVCSVILCECTSQSNYLSISFQQLHSSVRTGNLETCLRLLSLGAQANFFHPVSVVSGWSKKKTFCEVKVPIPMLHHCVVVVFLTTGERKHSTTHSSKSRTNVTSRTVGSLWSWSRGSGLQWKDPHRLCKVKHGLYWLIFIFVQLSMFF